jgi:hypothetical protein
MHVLKLTLGKIIIFANFPLLSAFQCEASERTGLSGRNAFLSIVSLASGLSRHIGITSGQNPYRFLSVFLLSLPSVDHCINFIMLCCVFFSRISPEILTFSAHLISFHNICCVFLYFFKILCFLEY